MRRAEDDAVLVDVVRTASGRGKVGGALETVHPADLLAATLDGLIRRVGLDPSLVDDVIGGCTGQVGDQAMNIVRTAVLAAGFPDSVPATTIDRQCGSGQQAVDFAARGVMSGGYEIVIACGVESMSRVPMGLSSAHGKPFEPLHTLHPEGIVGQGVSAELVAARWNLCRSALDEFSARSHARAAQATALGEFDAEVLAIDIQDSAGRRGKHLLDQTVRPGTTIEDLARLDASFWDEATAKRFPEIEWMVTAGNSSPLTDGAAAALFMSQRKASEMGLRPRARFHASTVVGSDPILMLTGVMPATHRVLSRAGLSLHDIDAFEVNEAFASVPLAWLKEFPVDPARLNPRGGAIALGHPLGATGVRILATLVNHLEATGGKYGLQTMCEGGGMANATIIECI